MGNRGNLHAADGSILNRRWASRLWISCRLEPIRPGYCAPMDDPHGYTPLFFTDEAVALAAGHRPCAQCRRDAYKAFVAAWRRAFSIAPDARLTASMIDAALHADRLNNRQPRRHRAMVSALPDGSFFAAADAPDQPLRKDGTAVSAWHDGVYRPHAAPPDQAVTVLTPPAMLAVLAAGYAPALA